MNINAGTNSYNITLKKLKEEKRPTFSTIFDKLDARSKKLNNKNPLNAVMTNEQMYRYYLEEVEPMLQGSGSDDLDTLDEILGNKNIKDMKLSEFAKLLMGNVNDDKGVKYETLAASVSSNGVMSIAPVATPPTPTPTPPPTPPLVPMSSGTAPVMGSLGGSGATGVGLSAAPTGTTPPATPTPTTPAVAPVASAPVASAPVASAPVASAPVAATPAATPAAAPAPVASALTISTAPSAGLLGTITSAISSVITTAKPSASGTSVPPSAVAGGGAAAAGGGAAAAGGGAAAAGGGAAAAGGGGTTPPVSPTAGAPVSPTPADGGYVDKPFQDVYAANVALGYNPPTFNPSLPSFSSKNKGWIEQLDKMNKYNKSVIKNELKFPFTSEIQKRVMKALDVNSKEKDPIKFVYDNIKKDAKYLNNPMFKP